MKNLLGILRRPFRVSYRLSVLYQGDSEPRHICHSNARRLRRMARNTEAISVFWSLYKSGPFGLPEREIDSYMKEL